MKKFAEFVLAVVVVVAAVAIISSFKGKEAPNAQYPVRFDFYKDGKVFETRYILSDDMDRVISEFSRQPGNSIYENQLLGEVYRDRIDSVTMSRLEGTTFNTVLGNSGPSTQITEMNWMREKTIWKP